MSKRSDDLKSVKLKRPLSLIALALAMVLLTAYEMGCIGDIYEDLNGDFPRLGIPKFGETGTINDADIGFEDAQAMFCCVDVGQGDCLLVVSGEDSVLIDAGNKGDGDDIADFLWNLGVDDLDLIVATHQHSDHIGGMDEIICEYGADRLIYPPTPEKLISGSSGWEQVLEAAEQKGTQMLVATAGDVYNVGDIKITVLSPWGDEPYSDLNEWSLALLVEVEDVDIFTAGDASSFVEDGLLSAYPWLYADIYKVSHHGSSDANSIKFLRALEPDYACISCGKGNSYGHPHSDTTDSLNRLGISYMRTDTRGDIVYLLKDGEIGVWTEK